MSTIVYAKLTSKRIAANKGKSSTDEPPGISTYADMVSALVPAEVIAAQTLIVSLCTKVSAGQTTITNRVGLETGFYGLLALSLVLYFGGRITSGGASFVVLDWVRMLIPPAAFVLWTMFLNTSTFDGAVTSFSPPGRYISAILGAIFVGGLAKMLGYKIDQDPPQTPETIAKQRATRAQEKVKKLTAQNAAAPKAAAQGAAPGAGEGEGEGQAVEPAPEAPPDAGDKAEDVEAGEGEGQAVEPAPEAPPDAGDKAEDVEADGEQKPKAGDE